MLQIFNSVDEALESNMFCDYLDKIDLMNAYLMLRSPEAREDLYLMLKDELDNPFEGMYRIPYSMFANCTRITNIDIPANCKSIGVRAFSNMPNLEDAVLANGVESIKLGAFRDCKNLESVYIPASVNHISDFHYGCPKLTICCKPGSFADRWAQRNGLPIEYM